jgi:hypothetical protein
MGLQTDYNPTLIVPPPGGKPTAEQAKYALLAWADQSDQHAKQRRSHYGKMALTAGAAVVALNAMLPRRAPAKSSAPSSGKLLGLASLVGLVRSAVALAPTALRAHAMYKQFQLQRGADDPVDSTR